MSCLAYQRYGQGEPLVVLHGLFGSADNWRGLARRWSETFGVWCVDLRNHGRSFHALGMNYTLQAEDVLYWMDSLDLERVTLLGHSMGGKLAMEFALRYPSRVQRLILADIAPIGYQHTHEQILKGLRQLHQQAPWHERRLADQCLAEFVSDVQTRLFLLTNLIRSEEGLVLRLGLEEISRDYAAIIAAPPAIDEGLSFSGPTLALRGTRSDYVLEAHMNTFRQGFPQVQVVDLEAGHWVHAEQPEHFYQQVQHFMLHTA